MAAKTYEGIMRNISAKEFSPIYFLYGTEPYYIDSIASKIEQEALPEDMKAWNQTVIYGRDATTETIIHEACMYPMGDRRVVILREGQDLESQNKGKIDGLIPYCNPKVMQQTTVLVICYKMTEEKKPARIIKLAAEVEKAGGVVLETKRLYDNQVVAWINQYVGSQHITIDYNAAEMLAEYVGVDISTIIASIEKLKVAVGGNLTNITADMIQAHIGLSKDYNIFEFRSALLSRKVDKVNRIVKAYGANEKQHQIIPIIANLYPVFRKILTYHYCKNQSQKEILQAVGEKSDWALRENVIQPAQYYNALQCYNILLLLEEYDMRSKGLNYPSLSTGELLRELVFRIMNC
ncbi:MAG: DNA polymerase III subunit delta [Bacteroidales bacterium]|nr:DNA polymerase III subunit delta [Bacteroidales bacterium]